MVIHTQLDEALIVAGIKKGMPGYAYINGGNQTQPAPVNTAANIRNASHDDGSSNGGPARYYRNGSASSHDENYASLEDEELDRLNFRNGNDEENEYSETEDGPENEDDRSNKLHNIWSKFESGQLENIEARKRRTNEIKELKAEILRMKMAKRAESLASSETDYNSQTVMEQMEQERNQELDEIRLKRQNTSSKLKKKFENIAEKSTHEEISDEDAGTKHELVPESDSEVLKQTSEQRRDLMQNFKRALESGEVTNLDDSGKEKLVPEGDSEMMKQTSQQRKGLIENFKKTLEAGASFDTDSSTKASVAADLANLETNTKLLKEKILNASMSEFKEKAPINIFEGATDSKSEYVSEPRTDIQNPNLIRQDDKLNQIDAEIHRLKTQGTGAALFKQKFETLAATGESPDSSMVDSTAGEGGNSPKKNVYNEILALVKEGQEQHMREESERGPSTESAPSHEDVALTGLAETRDKIAKFKAIERGLGEAIPSTPRAIREITPPREGEKSVYENEPVKITHPNYISANSPGAIANAQIPGSVANEGVITTSTGAPAKSLANFFESIPHTPNQLPKETPNVKRFTDPKIQISPEVVDSCALCRQKIYPVDKMEFNNKAIHKNCFKCKACGTPLRLENYATHNNDLYCTPHFKQLFANEPNINK